MEILPGTHRSSASCPKHTRSDRSFAQEGFTKGERGSTFSAEEMRAMPHLSDAWANRVSTKIKSARGTLLFACDDPRSSHGISAGLEVETLTPAQIVEVASRQRTAKPEDHRAGKRRNGRVRVGAVARCLACVAGYTQPAGLDRRQCDRRLSHKTDPRGYTVGHRTDCCEQNSPGVFADVLDHLGLRRDPVSGVFPYTVLLSALLHHAKPYGWRIYNIFWPKTWATARQ